ncbi:hypothetical protein BMF94_2062 [Rhodotorula taiwanensis]|uniref:Allergen n=1 Tax=Rhodotorula taiwanensis TaxID=741276 RepID=A0A2S5BDE6_9BASI|nr:hypothetical protein BMF94_2062 [Rhodotorula taiwanensis]
MDKIKQVFSHDSTKKEEHHHNAAAGTTTAPPTRSSAGDREQVVAPTESRAATAETTAPVSNTAPTSDTGLTGARRDETASGVSGLKTHEHEHGAHGAHLKEVAKPPAHQHQHPREDGILDVEQAKHAQHDHQHLAPVTHERHHVHEVEEVERQREVDRNIHHVQHHVQPVLDEQHGAETVQQKVVPQTEVRENHVATDEDKAQFASLATARDEFAEGPREKTIIDKGEKVVEHDHHHVHHVVQPVIERDVHEHNRIKTTIPVHQTIDDAPIVHQSVQHEPLKLDQFVAGGGDINSTLKHDGSLLERGQCERTVDGPAESMTEALGLSQSGTTGSTPARV